MNPSKVLLITLVGPYGEVDVAVRADLPAADLLPAFNELVGIRRGGDADSAQGRPARPPQGQGSGAPGGAQERRPPSSPAGPVEPQPPTPPAGRAGGGRHAVPTRPNDPSGPAGPVGPADPGGQGERPPAAPEERGRGGPVPGARSQGTSGPGGQGATAQRDRRDIPLGGTLADAGIVDGTVIHLYRASREQREQEANA